MKHLKKWGVHLMAELAFLLSLVLMLTGYPPVEGNSQERKSINNPPPLHSPEEKDDRVLDILKSRDSVIREIKENNTETKEQAKIAEKESKKKAKVKVVTVTVPSKDPNPILYKEPDKSDSIIVVSDSTYVEMDKEAKPGKKSFWKRLLGRK